jgi:hypothetical protein
LIVYNFKTSSKREREREREENECESATKKAQSNSRPGIMRGDASLVYCESLKMSESVFQQEFLYK